LKKSKKLESVKEELKITNEQLKNIKKEYEAYKTTLSKLKNIKPVNIIKHQHWNKKLKQKLVRIISKKDEYLITMELRTGEIIQFIVQTNKDHYIWNNGVYIIDPELITTNKTAKKPGLDYHESLSFPIRRRIPIEEIQKALKTGHICDLEMASNPMLLDTWQNSNLIDKVMRAADIDKVFKTIKIIGIFTLIIVFVTLAIYIGHEGILSEVKI